MSGNVVCGQGESFAREAPSFVYTTLVWTDGAEVLSAEI